MATIKHLTSKNSNYAAAESYLTFQHNEYTGLPILDEKGRPKLRDSYLLDTLECGESSFAMACLIANRKYGKNGGREDVKTHHYIISFDPKDAVENDLTIERAQALGLQFCKDNFPGHPAIVCTHPDGHNSAGNIHVHIDSPHPPPRPSAACVSAPWNGRPSWTSRATGKRARSTAAPLPCSGTSVSQSWRCASKPT